MSSSRSTRRLRTQVDVPGLRASVVADVDVVVAVSGSSSSRSVVRVEQRGAARTPAPTTDQTKETP